MNCFHSIDTNNQYKKYSLTISFLPPEWFCFPSGLYQQRIKDKNNKPRSFEISKKHKKRFLM